MLWTLRNSTDAFGNVKEGAGYTTPPTPLFHNGGYTDPATGWTSPTDGGLAGDYDSGTGDALDEAALSGRNGLYRGMLGKASQIAGVGLEIGDFIASFNPIFNAGMVVTGQKASGRKGSAWDRVFAGLSILPEGAIGKVLEKLGAIKGLIRGFKRTPKPPVSSFNLLEIVRGTDYLTTNNHISVPKVELLETSFKNGWDFPIGENAIIVTDRSGKVIMEGNHHFVAYRKWKGIDPPASAFRRSNEVVTPKQWHELEVLSEMLPIDGYYPFP